MADDTVESAEMNGLIGLVNKIQDTCTAAKIQVCALLCLPLCVLPFCCYALVLGWLFSP